LELALADSEPGIRLDAARGIARHPGLSVVEREQLLLGAFAAEPSVAGAHDQLQVLARTSRIGMLELLADVWPNASSPAIAASLRSEASDEMAGACRALGRLAQRGHVPSTESVARILELLLGREPEGVKADCALALRQPALAELLPHDRADLAGELLKLTDKALPTLALPVLDLVAQFPAAHALTAIDPLVADRSTAEAVIAVRAVARRSTALPRLVALTNQELARDALTAERLPVLLALFAALESHVQQPEVIELAERAAARLSTAPNGETLRDASARAIAHCAAGALADLARRWPKHVLGCGAGIAPDSVRDTWIAEVVASAPDSPEVRAAHLRRILAKPSLRARSAAIAATASLPLEHAVPLLVLALESAEPASLAAALRALPRRAPELRARPELLAALLASGDRAEAAPEAALAFIHAAQTLLRPNAGSKLAPALRDRITRLAEHSALGIREPARALLDEWQQHLPLGHRSVDAPIAADQVPAAATLFHVKLSIHGGGTIELELDPRPAPAAVRAFLRLVEDRTLDGLAIESLAAGRVIGFRPAAPPGFALRHEDFDGPVEEGSVVLQDHGRDVVGPSFALILSRTPELDRRVTVIGRVRSGLETAHALHLGDRIQRAELSR
jgi:peptidyl-prolyl cis-trans isomerase B (cyclophilin B)